MKRSILSFFFLASAFLACQQPAKQPAPPIAATPKNHLEGYPNGSPLIQAYTQYLRTLDTNDLTSGQPALQEYQLRFKGQPPAACDTGFMLFWSLLRQLNADTLVIKKYLGDYPADSLILAEMGYASLSPRGQKIRRQMDDVFFIVTENEGDPYLIPAWRLMANPFSPYISQAMKEVIIENAKDEKEGFQNDGGLLMTSRQLGRRTAWWEAFLARNPHHLFTDQARNTYNLLLGTMVRGMDNTPLMDVENPGKLNPFFDTAYQLIRDSFPASRTNAVITPFWQAVLAKDARFVKKIRDSLDNLPLY